MEISESYINKIKDDGFRPCAMAALIFNKKIALFSSRKYPGYYLLQGGIETFETPAETVEREVLEELGYNFYSRCQFPPSRISYLFEDSMESKNIKDKIIQSDGKEVKARGKHYFVYAVDVSRGSNFPSISSADYSFEGASVEYQKCKWAELDEARTLLATNTNHIKRKISLRVIDEIAKANFI